VRVEPALLPFGIFEAVELDGALPDTDCAKAANPARIAQQLAFDAEALLAVFVDDKPRPTVAKFGINVPVLQVERLKDVAVGVDDIICPRHRQSLRTVSSSGMLTRRRNERERERHW
jgi:hypothetical protein